MYFSLSDSTVVGILLLIVLGVSYLLNNLSSYLALYRLIYWSIPETTKYYIKKTGQKIINLKKLTFGSSKEDLYIIADRDVAVKLLKYPNINYLRFGSETGLKEIGMYDMGTIWNESKEKWEKNRAYFNHSLTSDHLKKSVVTVEEACTFFSYEVAEKFQKVDMLHSFRRITLDVTLKLMFGVDDVGVCKDLIIESINNYFKAWEYFLLRPFFVFYLPFSDYKKHHDCVKRMEDVAEKVMNSMLEKKTCDSSPEIFIDFLIKAYRDEEITKREFVQDIIEMFIAGTDTSSVTLYYTLICLLEHPVAMKKVLEEVHCFCKVEKLTKEDIDKCEYLKLVLQESMRIKPVGPVILRKAYKSFSLTNQDESKKLGTTKVKKGTKFIFDVHSINMDASVYENPNEFNPDRFKEENLYSNFFPFGFGKKSCAGRDLAMIEMKVIVIKLLTSYTFEQTNKESILKIQTHWDIANQPVTTSFHQVIPKTTCIFISGAHSVGKTTLIDKVKDESNSSKFKVITNLSELGRETLKEMAITKEDLKDLTVRKHYQKKLLEKQVEMFKNSYAAYPSHISFVTSVVLFDRSIIDNLTYCKIYHSEELYQEMKENVKNVLKFLAENSNKCFHFFVVEPREETIKEDGVRMVEPISDLWKFTKAMKEIYTENGIHFHVIKDDVPLNDRSKYLENYINNASKQFE